MRTTCVRNENANQHGLAFSSGRTTRRRTCYASPAITLRCEPGWVAELQVRAAVLNRFTRLGTSITVQILLNYPQIASARPLLDLYNKAVGRSNKPGLDSRTDFVRARLFLLVRDE